VDIVGRLSIQVSLITTFCFHILRDIASGAKLEDVSSSIEAMIDSVKDSDQLINSSPQKARQALRSFITMQNRVSERLIKERFKSFFDYAKVKDVDFEDSLHILYSSFKNWSFLKWISDDIVLETYGFTALNILKKYKETYLSNK